MAVVTTAAAQIVGKFKDDFSGPSKRAFEKFKRAATVALRVVAAAAAAAFALLGGSAIKAALDVIESENLFRESFKGMADAARKWSVETGKALGLNQFELRKSSALIFTMTRSMGLNKDAAFGMATGMTQLAHDMASFFNLNPDEAFQKLRSGIVGETEPLRQLGILVDENTVKQAAYNHGLARSGQELTQLQKVQARWLAILDQTTTAQGDLARTMDSPSNMVRRITTQFKEQITVIGIHLIPTFKDLLKWLDFAGGKMLDFIIKNKAFKDTFRDAFDLGIQIMAVFLDALDAVQIGLKELEVAAAFIASGINELISLVLRKVGGELKLFISNITHSINSLAKDIDDFLGTDFGKIEPPDLSFIDVIIDAGPASTRRVNELRKELSELIKQFAEESSGDKVRTFFTKVIEGGRKAQDALANIPATPPETGGNAPPSLSGEEEKKLLKRLEDLQKFLANAEELENISHQKRMESLRLLNENKIGSDKDRLQIELDLEKSHQAALAEIKINRERFLQDRFGAQPDVEAAQQVQNPQEAIMAQLAAEEELERMSHQRKLEDLNLFHQQGLVLDAEHRAIKLDLEKQHQDQLTFLRQSAATRAAQIDMQAKSRALSAGQNLASSIGRINQGLFDEMQVASSAMALVNAYLAASQVLADPTVPFYGKIAAAASMLAAGLNFVSSIDSLGNSSGGGGGGGGGGGSAPAVGAAPQSAGPTFILPDFDEDDLVRGSAIKNLFRSANKHLDKGGRLVTAR